MRGHAKLLSRQLLALPDRINAAAQRNRRLLQQLPLPDAADQSAFAGAEKTLREPDQGRNQLRQSVPAFRGNLEPGLACRLGHWATRGIEIDLVAHQPDRR